MGYNFQSMDFSLYSKYKLKIKIIINSKEVNSIERVKFILKKIKGRRRVISISKIKKISLIKKNWILKGMRFKDNGSNPHSKGEDFSRSWNVFFEIIKFNRINKSGIMILSIKSIGIKIIYIND